MTDVYIALGSNLGDRLRHLQAAVDGMAGMGQVLRRSPVYQTEPWGYAEQPAFLNQVVELETQLAPQDLLINLKELEVRLGRRPSFRFGPRAIDLDIVVFGQQVIHRPELQIPHPRLAERAFVLVPLADLAPELRIPPSGKTVADLLAAAGRSGVEPYSEPLAGPTPQENSSNSPLEWGARTYVMGIVNVTPDSFSGDGLLQGDDLVPAALAQARQFAADGADIIDVGGESTRPGSQAISAGEELRRVIPVVQALVLEGLRVIISVDTYKAEVADAALQAGARWVNDVWALRADPDMAAVVARRNAALVLMHNRSRPADASLQARLGGRYVGVHYDDLLQDVRRELLDSVELARRAGIPDRLILLDPGIGFGKTVEQNLTLINHLDDVKSLGYPVLLGPSRKSFIGYTLDLPPDQRVEGTAAAVVVGILRGADIVRVHDVQQITRVVRMTDAILGKTEVKAPPRSDR